MGTPAIHSTFGTDSARARRTDPESSHEAADHNDVAGSIGAVLDTLQRFGAQTDEQLVYLMGRLGYRYTGQRIRTARAALVKAGSAAHTGTHGQTITGRRARIWAVTAGPRSAQPELFDVESDPRR